MKEHSSTDAASKTDFRNTIIIATSNAGALLLRDLASKRAELQSDLFKQAVLDGIIKERTFTPEFLNRFDEVILYEPLNEAQTQQLARLLLQEVVHDVEQRRGVTVRVDDAVLTALVKRGYSVDFGARAMRRAVTELIENHIADYMLRNEVKRGDVIDLHAQPPAPPAAPAAQ